MPEMQSRFLTIEEAKREFKYSTSSLYRDMREGRVRAVKRGEQTLVERESLEQRFRPWVPEDERPIEERKARVRRPDVRAGTASAA